MRYREILREMSYAEAKAIWLKHGVDPERLPKPELAVARRKLIMQVHPDIGGNVEDAKDINAAYDVLKNPQSSRATNQNGNWEETPQRGRRRNWWHSEQQEREREQEQEESDAPWVWAGYSGGMRDSAHIYRQDYTDVNFIKKRMWELSGKSKEEWTIWGFDGTFTRGVTTVYGSPKIFAQMAEAMIVWQTKGGNPYECRAVVVEKREKHRSKPFEDDEDDAEHTVYLIWADGVFYDKEPIPVRYETFNHNPGNDRSFGERLRKLIDDLRDNQGRRHEQSSMHAPGGSDAESDTFETGSYVVHPKHGVGRVLDTAIKRGMVRVTFKKNGQMKTGNVKASSLRKATRREQWQYDHGE